MSAGKSVSDILAGAKAELGKADSFDKSVKSEAPPAPAPTPAKHEYSSAPYALVGRVKKATGNDAPKGGGLSDELSAKRHMLDVAKKALE